VTYIHTYACIYVFQTQGSRFTHPLCITEVASGSEAEWLGVQQNDVIVRVRTTQDLVFREVKPEMGKSDVVDLKEPKLYVENSIRDILCAGGKCVIEVKRRRGQMVCERCHIYL